MSFEVIINLLVVKTSLLNYAFFNLLQGKKENDRTIFILYCECAIRFKVMKLAGFTALKMCRGCWVQVLNLVNIVVLVNVLDNDYSLLKENSNKLPNMKTLVFQSVI